MASLCATYRLGTAECVCLPRSNLQRSITNVSAAENPNYHSPAMDSPIQVLDNVTEQTKSWAIVSTPVLNMYTHGLRGLSGYHDTVHHNPP
jgi:hypothetical protein